MGKRKSKKAACSENSSPTEDRLSLNINPMPVDGSKGLTEHPLTEHPPNTNAKVIGTQLLRCDLSSLLQLTRWHCSQKASGCIGHSSPSVGCMIIDDSPYLNATEHSPGTTPRAMTFLAAPVDGPTDSTDRNRSHQILVLNDSLKDSLGKKPCLPVSVDWLVHPCADFGT